MKVRATADTLRRNPLFRDCDNTSLQVLAFSAQPQTFANGNIIVYEGDPADAMVFICQAPPR
jgi:CRP-like cAMP-binding protein